MSKGIDHTSPPLEDEQIVDLYWGRDERAIRETDRKYGELLYQLAYNILHDRCDCEECQNDAYLGIWNSIPPTRPQSFPAYITRIMRHLALTRYRERNAQKRVPSELTVSMEKLLSEKHTLALLGVEASEPSELSKLISEFVRALPDRQRYIFIGRYFMSDPVGRIARELSVTESTVYRELERIRTQLRQHLERSGITL